MPLPPLLLPDTLPPFLVAGHVADWASPYADVPMATGHARKRRICTMRPKVATVSLFLEREQTTDFHAWFRDTLKSGERSFSAQVKEQGAGLLWYEAQFVAMYQAEALHFGRWVINAQLRLIGNGQIQPPDVGSFSVDVAIPLLGTGTLSAPKNFAAEISIPLLAATRFSVDVEIALLAAEPES